MALKNSLGLQAIDSDGNVVSNVFTPIDDPQKLTPSGSSVQSAVFDADNITVVRIVSDADIHYKIGANPTATTGSWYLPADVGEQLKIPANNKIAVIGTANVYVGLVK